MYCLLGAVTSMFALRSMARMILSCMLVTGLLWPENLVTRFRLSVHQATTQDFRLGSIIRYATPSECAAFNVFDDLDRRSR